MKVSGNKLRWYMNILKPIPVHLEWWLPSARSPTFFVILHSEMVKTGYVEGVPRGPSCCPEADSSSRYLTICPNIDAMESNQFFSSLGVVRNLLTFSYVKEFLTGEKLSDCILETWDLSQMMPVKYEMQD